MVGRFLIVFYTTYHTRDFFFFLNYLDEIGSPIFVSKWRHMRYLLIGLFLLVPLWIKLLFLVEKASKLASKTSKATSKPSNLETNLFKIYYTHYVFENDLKKKYLIVFSKIRILKKKEEKSDNVKTNDRNNSKFFKSVFELASWF